MTTGDADCADVAWRPDGAELAFVSARHERADRDLVRDVYAVATRRQRPAAGHRGPRRLRAPGLRARTGGSIYVIAVPDLGPDGVDFVARQAVPCRVRRRTAARCEPLLDPEVHHVAAETPRRSSPPTGCSSRSSTGERCTCSGCRSTAAEPEALIDGPFTVRSVAAAGGVVVATVAHDRSAGELIALTPGRRRLLTEFGRPLGRDRPGARMAGADGDGARRLPGARLGDHAARARARTRCC